MDQREAREVGEMAVQFSMWRSCDGTVAIKRSGFYSVEYELVSPEKVAGKTRVMEDEFIAPNGSDVSDAFRLYLRPLLGSGMPDALAARQSGHQGDEAVLSSSTKACLCGVMQCRCVGFSSLSATLHIARHLHTTNIVEKHASNNETGGLQSMQQQRPLYWNRKIEIMNGRHPRPCVLDASPVNTRQDR